MTYRVSTDGLNVRNRVNGKVVDQLSKGHIVEVVATHQGRQLEWARVTYDRYGGWVVLKFLEKVQVAPELIPGRDWPPTILPPRLKPLGVLGHRNWGEVALTIALFFIILFIAWGTWELS